MESRTKATLGMTGLVGIGAASIVGLALLFNTSDEKARERVTPPPPSSWCSYAKFGAGTRVLDMALHAKNGSDVVFLVSGFVNQATPKAVLPPLKVLVSGIEDVVAHNRPVGERVASAKTVAAAKQVDTFVAANCKGAK